MNLETSPLLILANDSLHFVSGMNYMQIVLLKKILQKKNLTKLELAVEPKLLLRKKHLTDSDCIGTLAHYTSL